MSFFKYFLFVVTYSFLLVFSQTKYSKIEDLYKNKKYNEVISQCNQELAKNSQNVEVLVFKSKAIGGLGNYSQAYDVCKEALSINPDHKEALEEKAYLLDILGDFKNSLKTYDKILALYPNDDLAKAHAAMVKVSLQNYNEAYDDLKFLAKKGSPVYEVYLNKGLLEGHFGDFKTSITSFTKAISINNEDERAYFNRGNTYYMLGKFEEALLDLNKTILLNPQDYEAYIIRAHVYINLKQEQKAIDDCTHVIEHDKNNIDALITRGIGYYHIKKFMSSIADFDLVIHLQTNNVEALYYRALSKKELNDSTLCYDLQQASDLGHLPSKDLQKSLCKK